MEGEQLGEGNRLAHNNFFFICWYILVAQTSDHFFLDKSFKSVYALAWNTEKFLTFVSCC